MVSTSHTLLPTSPDALRDLVLSLLQQQEEQEAVAKDKSMTAKRIGSQYPLYLGRQAIKA